LKRSRNKKRKLKRNEREDTEKEQLEIEKINFFENMGLITNTVCSVCITKITKEKIILHKNC
jgi:hypothetical protein